MAIGKTISKSHVSDLKNCGTLDINRELDP